MWCRVRLPPGSIVDDIVRGLPAKGGCKAHHYGFRDDQSVRRVEVLAHPVFLHFQARQDVDRMHQRGGSGDKGTGQGDQLKFVRAAATFMILYHAAQHHMDVCADRLGGHHHHFRANRISFLRHRAAGAASGEERLVDLADFRLHH